MRKTKMLVLMTMLDIMGNKNSKNKTIPDSIKAMGYIIGNVAKRHQYSIPAGVISDVDVASFLQTSGYKIEKGSFDNPIKNKKTIIHEIHKGDVDEIDFVAGSTYLSFTTEDKKHIEVTIDKYYGKETSIDDKQVVSFAVSYPEDLTLNELIKYLSLDISNGFIIVSPNEEQDIIVDFTLTVEPYFDILNNTAITNDVANLENDFECGATIYSKEDIKRICDNLSALAVATSFVKRNAYSKDLYNYRDIAISLLSLIHWLTKEDIDKINEKINLKDINLNVQDTYDLNLENKMRISMFKKILKLVTYIVNFTHEVDSAHSHKDIVKSILKLSLHMAHGNKQPYRLPFEGKSLKEFKRYLKDNLTC